MADNNIISPGKSPSDTQVVVGPDKKYYSFKKSRSPEYINNYFTKKGWQLKDGKWSTASGESVDSLTKVGSPPPKPGEAEQKRKQSLDKMGSLETDAVIATSSALPGTLGLIGGMLGRTPGAAIGGALGKGAQDYIKGAVLNKSIDPKQAAKDMSVEGVKQAIFQKSGEKVGDVFFNQLNKLPHAVTKKGIPLLPGDLENGSKLSKYVEDLLGNLAPSSKIMGDFRTKQNEAIIKQTTKLANGFAKFNGTSEEMGILVRNTLRANEAAAYKNLETVRKSLPVGKQTMAYLKKTPEYKNYIATFDYQLMRNIIRTNKPELIAGALRSPSASLEETRQLTDYIHEINPEILGKVQNTILRDVLNESMTGSKDPMMKQTLAMTKNFSGGSFKGILDKVGEQKLKALYGQKGYQSIEDFTKIIAHVDKTQGGGIGKFLNLTFLLPFRSGLTAKGTGKVVGMGLIANRAAKIITSPEGVKLYENYIRASASQAPRLISTARDELIAFNEKSDAEFELEQQIGEDEYKKTLPKMEDAGVGTNNWRAMQVQK